MYGDVLGDGRTFQLRKRENADSVPRYYDVTLSGENTTAATEAKPVAEIHVLDDRLTINWVRSGDDELRNAVIELKAEGGFTKTISLRKPIEASSSMDLKGSPVAAFDETIEFFPVAGRFELHIEPQGFLADDLGMEDGPWRIDDLPLAAAKPEGSTRKGKLVQMVVRVEKWHPDPSSDSRGKIALKVDIAAAPKGMIRQPIRLTEASLNHAREEFAREKESVEKKLEEWKDDEKKNRDEAIEAKRKQRDALGRAIAHLEEVSRALKENKSNMGCELRLIVKYSDEHQVTLLRCVAEPASESDGS